MSYQWIVSAEASLSAEVTDWLARVDAADAPDDAPHGADQRGDELLDWMRDKQVRLARISAAKAKLEAEAQAAKPEPEIDKDRTRRGPRGRVANTPSVKPKPNAPRNLTDAESRIMLGHDGFIQAYNGQVAAVDGKRQIIVAYRAFNNGSDQEGLLRLLDATSAKTGQMPRKVSANSRFCSHDNLAGLINCEVRGYVTTGRATRPTSSTK